MRLRATYLIGFTMALTPWLLASAPASARDDASSSHIIRVAQTCPPGQHWEEAGYVSDGKWRNAHCAKDGGRE